MNALSLISPIDGRYHQKTKSLSTYFSEAALIKYRVIVEIKYFIALSKVDIQQFNHIEDHILDTLSQWSNELSNEEIQKVKDIEKITNHDVKAVEYLIKEKFDDLGLGEWKEWIHFGLTSQDINNTSFPLMIRDALIHEMIPTLKQVISDIKEKESEYHGVPMLARTHGQAASPTTVGKELRVFRERMEIQLSILKKIQICVKFGGATGNFNAHKVAIPNIDWVDFADTFAVKQLGLNRYETTTQIAHYDDLSQLLDCFKRSNTILIDFCRDVWTYISMDYFGQKTVKNEVGSSAMPHKVNPIDFENAEGNLGMANAVFSFLSSKLPISRLQRDLTDSTVLRNIGVPFGHTLIAYKSIIKGISKLKLNEAKLNADLELNYAVVAEAIQNILRRENYPKPYEALKELTRGKTRITKEDIDVFVNQLKVNEEIKSELLQITPHNYTGYH